MENIFKELLFEKFLEWQKNQREIKTQKEFADYIGIKGASLNHIMSGRRSPSRRIVEHLVGFFNDPRFYDSAGVTRPDPKLHYITRHWGDVPIEVQKRIAGEIEEYTNEKAPIDEALPPPDSGPMETTP
jgi:transcriptional regulator with XRE-family HTH domain